MGSGNYTTSSFVNYSNSMGRTVNTRGIVTADSLQDYYKQSKIHEDLKPFKIVRECCDSEEHPNTIPIILALDVTGSMGGACVKTAKALNTIMTSLYDKFEDVEFCIMGIGDLAYDNAPIQMSQYESDVRIAEHLDKVYMEHGGGGNGFESYTAAWYMGLRHTKLDCWKRGKKGIIITMGDEPLNPYLPKRYLENVTGDSLEGDVETTYLYKEAIEKFDIYHIAVDDTASSYFYYNTKIENSFRPYLGNRLKVATIEQLPATIVECINDSINGNNNNDSIPVKTQEETTTNYITW